MLKKILASILGAIILCSATMPTWALQANDPTSYSAIQPRFTYIHMSSCTLMVTGDGSATVEGWVDFISGNECSGNLVLKHNGTTVRSWVSKSSSGHISITKDVTGLAPGKYQAVFTATCKPDVARIDSPVKVI